MAATAPPATQPALKAQFLEDAPPEWDLQALLACCLGRPSNLQLSPEEREALQVLRERHCNEPFDACSPEAEAQLQAIWAAAFPEEALPKWKRLGFQGDAPRTDVRAGRFALDQLRHLAAVHPERLREFARQALELDYPFAISCFNLSHMVVVYFDLSRRETVSPVSGVGPAGRAQLKNFARLCHASPQGPRAVLDELFCALVGLLHETWRAMVTEEHCNLMEFPRAIKSAFEANAAFWREARCEVAELRLLAALGAEEPRGAQGERQAAKLLEK